MVLELSICSQVRRLPERYDYEYVSIVLRLYRLYMNERRCSKLTAIDIVSDLVSDFRRGLDSLDGIFISPLSTNVLKRHARHFIVHTLISSGKVACRSELGTVVIDCGSLVEEHQQCNCAWKITEHMKYLVAEFVKGTPVREIFYPLMANRIVLDCVQEVNGSVLHSGNESNFTEQHAEYFLLHLLYTLSNQAYNRLLSGIKRGNRAQGKPRKLKLVGKHFATVFPMAASCPEDEIVLQKAIKHFIIESQQIVDLVKESLLNPVTFEDVKTVHLDPGLDFGIHVLEDDTPIKQHNGPSSLLEMQQRIHLAAGKALIRGMVKITPRAGCSLWLCGGVVYPQFENRFLFCDQSNLFLHEYSAPHLLNDGVSYPIEVVMSTEDADRDAGMIKQDCVMLFCCEFSKRHKFCRTRGMSYRDTIICDRKYRIFCLGFKISAIILKKNDLDAYKKPLNIKAKPFYSKEVVDIFDQRPDLLYCAFEDDILDHLMVDRSLLPLCSYDALERDRVRYFDIPVEKKLVTRFAKLVQMEAMQQMIDIKGHDMHFCRFSVAKFGSDGSRMYSIICGEKKRHVYRGFMPNRKGSEQFLIVIKVPSIVEGHPAIYLGTIVHLRFIKNPSFEYNMICCGIDRDTVFLIPPREVLFQGIQDGFTGSNSLDTICSIRFGCSTASLRSMLNPLMDDDVVEFLPELDADMDDWNDPGMLPPKQKVHELTLDIMSRSMLNLEQASAVSLFLLGGGRSSPVTLLGPPGTGKTSTLTQCVMETLRMYPESKILCSAPVNFSADVIISELKKKGLPLDCMLRLNDPRRPVYSAKDDVLDCCIIDESMGIFRIPSSKEIERYQIVVCTCIASEFLPKNIFSHVLIDEAGQAIIPETLLPLRGLRKSDQVSDLSWGSWLCGDPKQLGPIVRNSIASQCGLSTSLLEVLGTKRPSHNCSLCQNYRSNDGILRLPSNMFYSSTLVYSGDAKRVIPPNVQWDEGSSECQVPLIFYGVNGEHTREGESHSYSNKIEAVVCSRLIRNLVDKTDVEADDIGVLALYRRQVYLIRSLLREQGLKNVRVGTLDDYQGQEEKVVFISTVISDMNDMGPLGREFFQNPNRFNVAITRAKSLLVVLGHPGVLSLDSVWKQYLREAMKNGGFFGSYKNLLDVDIDLEKPDDDASSIVSAFRNLAILGPGSLEHPVNDLDPFDEDTPWRILL